MKVWLFLPGNNDLIDEKTDTINYYRTFIDQLRWNLPGKEVIDLCPTDADPKSGVYSAYDGFAFIGFNNASFKNNNDARRISLDGKNIAAIVARTDPQKCEDLSTAEEAQARTGSGTPAELPMTLTTAEQLKYVQQVIDRINLFSPRRAYVFYHIPDIDDPHPVLNLDHELLAYRNLSLSDHYALSSWFVDGCVRSSWAKVVTNSNVRGLFAGHLHDWRRNTYQDFHWMVTPDYPGGTLTKLYVCPPISIKRQGDQGTQARGFQTVSIDGTGKVSVNVFWYDVAGGTFADSNKEQLGPGENSFMLASFIRYVWASIPSYLPFYLIVIVCLYAAIKGLKRTTVIAPFRMPSGNQLPFGEDTVANFLRDAFVEIRKRAEDGLDDAGADSAVREALGLRDFKLSAPSSFEVPFRFAVEVKGLSHEALVSFARKVLGKERIISGDVIGDKKSFSLLARCGADLWTCSSSVATIDGLKKACFRLAFSVLGTSDPSLLIAYTAVKAADVGPDKNEESLASLIEAVEQLPDTVKVESFNNLGSVLAREGRYDEAIENYEKALAIKPDHAGALYNLGNALLKINKKEEAIRKYGEALDLTPNDPDILFNLGYVFDSRQEFEKAIPNYRKALEIRPDDPALLYNLGIDLSKVGQTEEGLELVLKAQKLKPDDALIAEAVEAMKEDLDS